MVEQTRFDVGETAILNVPNDVDMDEYDGQEVEIIEIEDSGSSDIIDPSRGSDKEVWYTVKFISTEEKATIGGSWLD